MLAAGCVLATAGSAVVTIMLVKVLTGVFEPPPSSLAIPWTHLVAAVTVILAAVAAAAIGILRAACRPPLEASRDLWPFPAALTGVSSEAAPMDV